MALTAKSAHDKERQKLFEELRHLISSKHQVPDHVDMDDLYKILGIIKDKDSRF